MSMFWKSAPALLAATIILPAWGAQNTAARTAPSAKSATAGAQAGEKPMNQRMMMRTEERQKMMADMKAWDAKLQSKVAAMNAATGNDKINAMAAVLTELAQQHHEMVARMETASEQMGNRAGMNAAAARPSTGSGTPHGTQAAKAGQKNPG